MEGCGKGRGATGTLLSVTNIVAPWFSASQPKVNHPHSAPSKVSTCAGVRYCPDGHFLTMPPYPWSLAGGEAVRRRAGPLKPLPWPSLHRFATTMCPLSNAPSPGVPHGARRRRAPQVRVLQGGALLQPGVPGGALAAAQGALQAAEAAAGGGAEKGVGRVLTLRWHLRGKGHVWWGSIG